MLKSLAILKRPLSSMFVRTDLTLSRRYSNTSAQLTDRPAAIRNGGAASAIEHCGRINFALNVGVCAGYGRVEDRLKADGSFFLKLRRPGKFEPPSVMTQHFVDLLSVMFLAYALC